MPKNNSYNIKVVIPKGYAFNIFHDLGKAVSLSFQELGYDSRLIEADTLDGIEADICFIFAGHEFGKFNKTPKTKYILWQLEQLPRLGDDVNKLERFRFDEFKQFGDQYDYIFDFIPQQTSFLRSKGYNAHTLEVGYHPSFEKIDTSQNNYKYDVLFFGRFSDRRIEILHKLKKKCNIFYSMTLWGEEKLKVIAQSKICLNIHHDDNNSFEFVRIIPDLIANGKFVLTEDSRSTSPLVNNKHLVCCDYKDIVSSIEYYLKNQDERNDIARQGYTFIKNKHPLTNKVRKMLKTIN